jgi:hypothetical protein
VFIITIELTLSIQFTNSLTNDRIVEEILVQGTPYTNTSLIIYDFTEEQNKSKNNKAFGHFGNNQIQDGIVTWIQGGFWE